MNPAVIGHTGLSDKELEVIKTLADMGGSIFIDVLIIVALSFLAFKLGGKILALAGQAVGVMQNQADQTGRNADALFGQAETLSQMKDAISSYILKDNSEHREILLGVEVMADKLNHLTQAVKELKA